jgi:response regulator RpfG family c-di-GMP phosphodiesterase
MSTVDQDHGILDVLADDDLDLIDDSDDTPIADHAEPYVVLVVDDDHFVQDVTAMLLGDVRFRDRPLELISAFSGIEAEAVLRARDDIALVLLDVVMETDDAGLRLVKTIREDLANRRVRIVLRTGQPGQAPEREVIANYDINDYKSKSELTATKLYTATIAALRSFDDIVALEHSRRGLELIIDATDNLFRQRSLEMFARGVLTQIAAVLRVPSDGVFCLHGATDTNLAVLAATGRFQSVDMLESTIRARILACRDTGQHLYRADHACVYVRGTKGGEVVIFVHTGHPLRMVDRQLIEVFASKIAIALETIHLYEDLVAAHRASVVALADLAEFRDTDTGDHVLRVCQTCEAILSQMLAEGSHEGELDAEAVERMSTAAILHDVGKVSIPDAVLQKPGKLDAAERALMETHAATGATILARAGGLSRGQGYLSTGAIIARSHHEWWNGQGYPDGLAGTAIPLAARVTAVADVFDALTHERPYKKAWPRHEALAYIRERAGTQFDPAVVASFLRLCNAEAPDAAATDTETRR